uniref:DUF3800 domain-containing protein n=1 Tax=Schlesneria paludicola TaxID=360056 RepID=A0A7C4QPN1_9PLAN
MYILYVDESGDPGLRGSRFLLLAGAAIFEGKWAYIDRDIRDLIDRYFPVGPQPREIHWSELRSGKGLFGRLSHDQRSLLADEFCALVSGLLHTEIRFFSVIADKPWWFAAHPGKSGDDLYLELFEDLCQRFDFFLRRRFADGAPSKGMIVADPHKTPLCRTIRTHQEQFRRVGTKWSRLYNLIETVFFLDSYQSPGLQLADLCAYAVWRVIDANDTSLAMKIRDAYDREPWNSTYQPGKWHGVKLHSDDPAIRGMIDAVWSLV